jgi:colanic acid/amylovoran biosynthesis glycosyltransferase
MDNGIEVCIFPKHGKLNVSELKALQGFEKYGLEDKVINIDAYFIKNKGSRLLMALKTLIRLHKSPNRQFYYKALNLFKYKEKAWSLRLFFRVHYLLINNIEIIHAHYGPNGNEVAVFKNLGLPIKLVVTFHGYDIRLGINKGGEIYQKVFQEADGVVAISQTNKNYLLNWGLPKAKLIELPNGVDTNFFKGPTLRQYGNTIKILSVGRLVEEKALHDAIKAIQEVTLENPEWNINYTIIGDGALKPVLLELINNLNLQETVKLIGSKTTAEVRDIMHDNDLFLLSSISEVWPTVVLEAQAAGLVVLATNVGDIKTMLKGGYIVENHNWFAQELKSLINKKEQWRTLSERGIKYVEDNYSKKKIITQLLKFYR